MSVVGTDPALDSEHIVDFKADTLFLDNIIQIFSALFDSEVRQPMSSQFHELHTLEVRRPQSELRSILRGNLDTRDKMDAKYSILSIMLILIKLNDFRAKNILNRGLGFCNRLSSK